MKLTEYSRNRLMESLSHWRVVRDFAEPMYNYLVFGIEPGSFFRGWYANDAMAIIRSHSSNTVDSLKDLSKWILNCMPPEAWGSYDSVSAWTKLSNEDRRQLLERHNLVFTEREEIELVLTNAPMRNPFFHI